ncbi:hypothetical protein ASPCAL08480 [Aspergillus calidoustus]|uniref:Glutathione S-transferase kappa n=1 Tax=Aspergillus calidoustus TaxID=454130 RepID=A0A0U5HJU4_ASPCI|nr:hypothetical protein ASPCAL08480 [Aspergillus calidoustus]
MAAPKITLYFDIVSPFAHIAFHILRNSPTFSKCDLTFIPIFISDLIKACGNIPPIKIKNKAEWIEIERRRWAHYFSVPMSEQKPEGFPHLTLGVQRALVAVSQRAPEKLAPATEAIWKEYWVKGNGKATQREGFIPILEGVLGEAETKAVVEAASGAEVKARLSANTQQAFDSGAFGLPWFECTNSKGETEGFWGIDHLGQVADFLGLDRSVEGGFRAYL